jgi:hypothetical protein
MSTDAAVAFWRAVSRLRLDRALGVHELEICFAGGTTPEGLSGRFRGRLLATSVGHGFDWPAEAAIRLWMPWLGKTFDHTTGTGRNDFTRGAGRLMRLTLPRYPDLRIESPRRCSAFVFRTSPGPSALDSGVTVLRIDYRDIPANPSWPIRRVLDELVTIDDGLYLGQALLEWRGQLRRAAWFSLER